MVMIRRARLRRLQLPLVKPYKLSYRTFEEFEPFVVELEGEDGRIGFGDGHISPGSSSETRAGGWSFLVEHLEDFPGRTAAQTKARLLAHFADSKVAATAAITALDVFQSHPLLKVQQNTVLPLLTPIGSDDEAAIAMEVDEAIGEGFRTLKIKIGKDVDADLRRVAWIQKAVAGRAGLRIDANRAYSREDAIRFATQVAPDGIELFEQPCDADDWDANAAVAGASPLPLMLDEPISTLADIERAGDIPGVALCKVKLKRFGGLDQLVEGIAHIERHGMTAVLGDGLGSEIHSWLEACIAAHCITNAGEFNGFLKPTGRLFKNPLHFSDGAIHLSPEYWPQLDPEVLERTTTELLEFN